jgi:hypothetical protein
MNKNYDQQNLIGKPYKDQFESNQHYSMGEYRYKFKDTDGSLKFSSQ